MADVQNVLILGGGLAGAAAAVWLARHECRVTLIEREPAARHKVCGEFLSTEALDFLGELGIDPGAHNAHRIDTVRLASAHHLTQNKLPFPAQSLTRRCLDSLLLQAAEHAGATVLRGVSVEALKHDCGLWTATLSSGDRHTAPQVVLATGKHDLRGFPRPPGPQNDLVALKMYFRLSPGQTTALEHSVELLLHPYGYTGLQPSEDGAANLTALVRRKRLAKLGGWPGLINELKATNAHAAMRLQDAVPLLDKPLAISSIPYGFVRWEALAPGLYAVGDQAAVIPSFTGDGMSIALYTGLQAARAILAEQPASAFQPALYRQLRTQVRRATALSRALVNPALRPVLTTAASLWPGALGYAAKATRLPPSVLPRQARTGVQGVAPRVSAPREPE